jgi:hypothetical protein
MYKVSIALDNTTGNGTSRDLDTAKELAISALRGMGFARSEVLSRGMFRVKEI